MTTSRPLQSSPYTATTSCGQPKAFVLLYVTSNGKFQTSMRSGPAQARAPGGQLVGWCPAWGEVEKRGWGACEQPVLPARQLRALGHARRLRDALLQPVQQLPVLPGNEVELEVGVVVAVQLRCAREQGTTARVVRLRAAAAASAACCCMCCCQAIGQAGCAACTADGARLHARGSCTADSCACPQPSSLFPACRTPPTSAPSIWPVAMTVKELGTAASGAAMGAGLHEVQSYMQGAPQGEVEKQLGWRMRQIRQQCGRKRVLGVGQTEGRCCVCPAAGEFLKPIAAASSSAAPVHRRCAPVLRPGPPGVALSQV